ncbi:MAG: FAD-binding protein, partial [Longimicrobiales bacterium]
MPNRLTALPEGPIAVPPPPSGRPRDLTALVSELRGICGADWVFTQEHQLRTYESDGLLQYKVVPVAAVLPGTAAQVQAVVAACAREHVPWVARGAGSGLSGGALPIKDGVLLVLSRMT